jgi:hypothetical protein
MTLKGPRLLAKTLHGVSLSTNESGLITIDEGEWDILGPYKAVQRSYFDLSGYNKPGLTTFFQGVDFQYASTPVSNESRLHVYDFITTEYLSDAELLAVLGATIKSGPGFSASTLNMEQVIYARLRTYSWPGLPDLDSQSIPLHGIDLWGTCNATTADKLHITRAVVFRTASKTAIIADVNVVVTAIIGKEKDLVYMMRQKRSYELSTRES